MALDNVHCSLLPLYWYIYIYIFVFIFIYLYIRIYIYIHIFLFIFVFIFSFIHIFIFIYIHNHIHIFTYLFIFIYEYINIFIICVPCRSQWPRGLRHTSAAARLLRLWVRIPPGPWMSVYCDCCVLSGRGLCDELITRLQRSYRLWCVVVCDLETSWKMRPWLTGGCRAKNKSTLDKISFC